MRSPSRLFLFLCVAVSLEAFSQNFDLQRDRMSLAELKGHFRFHAGDDPHYADPSFDDSGWSLLTSDQSWFEQDYKNYSGFGWYRFRVTVPEGQKDFALFVPVVRDSFSVYSNGRLIGQIGDFPPHSKLVDASNQVFAVPAPAIAPDRTIVFAVRVWRWPLMGTFSGAGFGASPVFGEVSSVVLWAFLQIHNIFWATAQLQFMCVVNIAGMLLAFALFLLCPTEREYLWFGLAQVFWSIFSVAMLADTFLKTPTVLAYVANIGGLSVGSFLNLVFFHVLLRQRRRYLFWIGGMSMLFPVVFLFSIFLGWGRMQDFDPVSGLCYVPYAIAVPLLIFRVAFLGSKEAWLLIVPFTLNGMANVWSEAFYVLGLGRYPAFAGVNHFLVRMLSWPIHLNYNYVIGAACNLAICTVLILRFAHSRRDEERLSAEMEAARAVQTVLVPTEVPSIPGFVIEAVYKPAGQVGGDFFQIIPLPAGGALIAIGDVSGKGMPAAMTVSLLVGTFRTLAHYTQSPAEILAAMNTRMLARSQGGFTTCLVLRLDPDGTLTAANAGHIAPYIGGSELEIANDLPLGLLASANYTETVARLDSSDHLTLLTDGVIEARNARGELLGFDRARTLSTNSAEKVAQAAQAFGQEDDITVLTLRLAPASMLTT